MAIKKGNTEFKINLKNIITELERYVLYKKRRYTIQQRNNKRYILY